MFKENNLYAFASEWLGKMSVVPGGRHDELGWKHGGDWLCLPGIRCPPQPHSLDLTGLDMYRMTSLNHFLREHGNNLFK